MEEDPPVEWWKQGAVEGAPEPIIITPPKTNPFQNFEYVSRPEHRMSFMDSIENVIRNFVNFNDRASRSEYWWFQLFFFVALATADFIDVMMGDLAEVSFNWFGTVAFLGLIIPNLAVTVRRLHDLGYSGWFILLVFIPCLGSIIGLVILVFMMVEGQSQINDYGTVPTNTIVRE
jgi:uncharacterized membrane protein YhaH (DUF805 family)